MNLLHWSQSVINTAARTVAPTAVCKHSLSLAGLQWLRVPEQITFKLAFLAYRFLIGTALSYLASQLHHRVADMPCRQRLRSSVTQRLDIRPTRLTIVVERTIPVATARVWNSLPYDVTATGSIVDFVVVVSRLTFFVSPTATYVAFHVVCWACL
jgi:hypothetical protein